MRANVSTLHELEEWEGVRDGAKVMEIEGEAHPPKEEENEGRGGKAETPQNGKRKMGNERARPRGRRRRMWNGQKDAWCSRWCEKGGEGGSLCRPADGKASFVETDRWGSCA